MKKIKYFIPAIIWMIFIFIMSNTTGNQSANQSNFFVEMLINLIKIDPDMLSFIIRKTAHMSEYAILLLLIYYGLHKSKFNFQLLLSFLFTFIYACSDEFHQIFIPGRSGQFKDILIDSCGALVMLLIIYLWQKKSKH